MRVAAVIAEYNPFHNGHAHQLALLKEAGFSHVLVLMSGDFVQRGAPAIVDKYMRARMALLGGADVVLELPTLFAGASAETFASGAAKLLSALHGIDALCFGCETVDVLLLEQLADILNEEPAGFSEHLRERLRVGDAYPAARAAALSRIVPGACDFLATPNNSLALEYVRALRAQKSSLSLFPIKRQTGEIFRSAGELRAAMLSGGDTSSFLPETASELLREAADKDALLSPDDFSMLLRYRLLSEDDFSSYADCTEALSHRIVRCREQALTFGALVALLKTRELTYTRISRVLVNILLGHRQADLAHYRSAPAKDTLYAKLLGFRRSAAPLLSQLKDRAEIPLLSKCADAAELLTPEAASLFSMDIRSSRLYNVVRSEKTGELPRNDFNHPLEILL